MSISNISTRRCAPQFQSGIHSGRRGNAMKGCLIALGIVLVLAIGAGVWVWMNWKGLMADATKAVARDAVQQSQMPPAEKQRVIARIDTLADDFKSGKVSSDQMTNVIKEVAQSPLLPLGMVMAMEAKYITPSALTAEEKKDGTRSLQRFARGVFEKKIPEAAMQEIIAPISEPGVNGQPKIKEQVTTEELKKFLAAAKQKADDAKIPDEEFTVNVADELDKAIDKALGMAGKK